eukprot:SAG11_NODE_1268_length_5342_cov_1.710853_12_plen_56_part_01
MWQQTGLDARGGRGFGYLLDLDLVEVVVAAPRILRLHHIARDTAGVAASGSATARA